MKYEPKRKLKDFDSLQDMYIDIAIEKCESEGFNYVITQDGLYVIKICPNCGNDRYIWWRLRKARFGFCNPSCAASHSNLKRDYSQYDLSHLNKFEKGNIPWNKGIHKATNTGRTWFKKGQNLGSNHPNWKGGISSRNYSEDGILNDWRKAVFERDGYCCQICHDSNHRGRGESITLNAHHIKSWKDYPEERFNIDNGITLCRKCHLWVHYLNPLDFQ